jgi:hypothetical protein
MKRRKGEERVLMSDEDMGYEVDEGYEQEFISENEIMYAYYYHT